MKFIFTNNITSDINIVRKKRKYLQNKDNIL